MAKKQYTLIIDDEKDAIEKEIAETLEALGRGDRQRRLKEFTLIGSRLMRHDDLRYALISVLMERSDADIYAMIENTANLSGGKRSETTAVKTPQPIIDDKTEPTVKEEPEPEQIEKPEKTQGGKTSRYIE